MRFLPLKLIVKVQINEFFIVSLPTLLKLFYLNDRPVYVIDSFFDLSFVSRKWKYSFQVHHTFHRGNGRREKKSFSASFYRCSLLRRIFLSLDDGRNKKRVSVDVDVGVAVDVDVMARFIYKLESYWRWAMHIQK